MFLLCITTLDKFHMLTLVIGPISGTVHLLLCQKLEVMVVMEVMEPMVSAFWIIMHTQKYMLLL